MSIYLDEGAFWRSEKMAHIFSTESMLLYMCRVEAAIAAAESEMGIISRENAEKIRDMVALEYIDLGVFHEKMTYTGGHPVVSFLAAWKPSFGDHPAKNVIHYAASTPDIYDNMTLLRLRDAYEIILGEMEQVRDILRDLAKRYRDTPMAGRSHNQHAVPITFGAKVAAWLMEMHRQIRRLRSSAEGLFVVDMYGAAGGINTMGKRGQELNRILGEQLKMGWTPVSMQTSRDTMLEFASALANVIGTMGKIATELFELSRTEIGEVAEPWTYGNVGSSTMPQKRNPWGLETMIAISRGAIHHVPNVFGAMAQYHERDFMAYYQCDYSMEALCHMCEKILHYGVEILGKLDVYPDRMRKNLDMTNGALMLEHLMMVLTTKDINRYEAHQRLYDYAMKAYELQVPVKELIKQDGAMMRVLTQEELDEAFSYSSYLGCCPEQVDAALLQTEPS